MFENTGLKSVMLQALTCTQIVFFLTRNKHKKIKKTRRYEPIESEKGTNRERKREV